MAEQIGEAPFLMNLGFLITYKCQVACPHCLIQAGPNRSEEMAMEDALSWIAQAAAYRSGQVRAICLTGGEPFFDLRRLHKLVETTVSHGLLPTAVTNAFWAENRESANRILAEVSGLRVLSISADAHHQSQIPFSRVENAVAAADQLGLLYNVVVCTESRNDPAYLALISQLQNIVEADRIETVITFAAGRALATIRPEQYEMTDAPPNTACPGASSPTIFPDGRVYACIGPVIELGHRHPLLLGNLREKPLAELLDEAEANPVLHFLRVWGPMKLLQLLEEKGYGARLPRLFVKNSMCNACYSLMADPALCAAMTELAEDEALVEKIAYGRLHYLEESRMLELRPPAASFVE